ncbi:MAG: hypothetical protein ACI4CT_02845 [Lachnospiraceae bacterium]
MVNEEKVALMTELSIYRKREKGRNLRIHQYHKKDYIRMNQWKTLFISTASFLAVTGLVLVLGMDEILGHCRVEELRNGCILLLAGYGVFLAANLWFSYRMAQKRYQQAKFGNYRYKRALKKLQELYDEELVTQYIAAKEKEEEKNDDSDIGPEGQD